MLFWASQLASIEKKKGNRMEQKQSHFIENELRSSRIYKTLRGANDPITDSIASGLDAAAGGLEQAMQELGPALERGITAAQRTAAAWQANAPQKTQGNQQNPQGGSQNMGNRQTAARHRHAHRPAAQPQQGAPAPNVPMKLVRRKSPVKYYATGIAALLYAMNAPMYTTGNFITFGIVLLVVFLLSSAIFKGKKEFVPVQPEDARPAPQPEKKEEPKPAKTGNPEVDRIINEGNDYLRRLREADDAIPDETLSEDIRRMESASADIFRFIESHPEKTADIRKFMSYYLPTTLKLLNTYQRLAAQSVKGENITTTMFNIAGMMHTVADAFEKQLDSLFTDEAMDVSADISVFETLLKQEGFVEDKNTVQTRE